MLKTRFREFQKPQNNSWTFDFKKISKWLQLFISLSKYFTWFISISFFPNIFNSISFHFNLFSLLTNRQNSCTECLQLASKSSTINMSDFSRLIRPRSHAPPPLSHTLALHSSELISAPIQCGPYLALLWATFRLSQAVVLTFYFFWSHLYYTCYLID